MTAHGSLRFFDLPGPAEEPPLLLLHGLGANALGLLSLALSLDGARRCLVVDLFDFGGDSQRTFSPFGVRPLRVVEHAETIAHLVESQGIDTYDLYGVSLGAWIGLHVATLARAPRRMLLVSPLGTRADITTLRALARRVDEEGVDVVAERFARPSPKGRFSVARGVARLMLRAAASVGRTQEFARSLDDRDAIDDVLERIESEVRLLAPEHDRLVGSTTSQALFERLACVSGTWALGSSHSLAVESPGLVTLALRELVDLERTADEAPSSWARARLHVGTLPKLRPMVRS